MIDFAKEKTYNLLRWSEKWTGTDMVYLAKGGFWLTANKVVGTITSFALAIAYARLFPQEIYGTYKYILSVVGILTIFAMPGINTAIYRSVAIGCEGSVKSAFRGKLKWGAFAGFLGVLTAAYYFYQGDQTLAIGILIAALSLPLSESLAISNSIMQGRSEFKKAAILSSVRQLFISLSLIAILLLTKNLILFLLVYFSFAILADLLIYIVATLRRKLNKEIDPEYKSLSWHLSFMTIIAMASNYLDKIFTWHFLGAGAVAVYSFAIMPIDQAEAYLKSSQTLAFPKIASQETKTVKETLLPKLIKFSILLIVPVLLYIFIAPFLFKLFFPQYLESVKYSQIFALTLLFFPQRMIAQLLVAQARKKDLYIQNTLMPFIKIILMAVLIPFLGIWGAIYANFIYLILAGAMLYYFFKNLPETPMADLILPDFESGRNSD